MKYFNESINVTTKKNFILENYDIKKVELSRFGKNVFLSYSSKDNNTLKNAILFLEAYGVNVYIDKKDESLPRITSPETARILKENIKKCDKFVLLVSENTKESRWVPWELGIADISKNTNNLVLLPASKIDNPTWVKQEYLGLYDRITYEEAHPIYENGWIVSTPEDKKVIDLKRWLNR